MKIAVLGGGGAMGGLFGGYLARAGEDVTLIDVSLPAIEAINREGLWIEERDSALAAIPVKASANPAEVGKVDLIVNFVKGYHTAEAISSAKPMLGDETTILTLQNGWGNADLIAGIVGERRVLVGLTYHSGTLIGPGRVKHPNSAMTYVGELDGAASPRLQRVVEAFRKAGIETVASPRIVEEVWKKLALNVCSLPTAALLRFEAHELALHEETRTLMRALLGEVVAVARVQAIAFDEAERWAAITGLLERAVGARASMLQDVEAGRRTEIETVNGAIVAAGRRFGIATPYNEAMVLMVTALQGKYLAKSG